MTCSDTTIIIFAREPVEGKVKTRLLERLDAPVVTALYRQFVKEMIAAARRADCGKRWIYYTGAEKGPVFLRSEAPDFLFQEQSGADLGARMLNAFRDQAGCPTVIVGSDCLLSGEDINAAFCLLDDYDVVLGPAGDGGYYLVGAREPRPVLFEEMAWSTGEVFEETVRRARAAGLSVGILPEKDDIDRYEDLRDLAQRLDEYPRLSPQTAGMIRSVAGL